MSDPIGDKVSDFLTGPLWLVWSNEHRAWWGPNQRHYYWDIAAAGRYTLEEALDICKARGVRRGEGINPPELIQPAPEWFERRTEIITGVKREEGNEGGS